MGLLDVLPECRTARRGPSEPNKESESSGMSRDMAILVLKPPRR